MKRKEIKDKAAKKERKKVDLEVGEVGRKEPEPRGDAGWANQGIAIGDHRR